MVKRRLNDKYLSGFLLLAALLFAGLLVSQQEGSPTGLVPGALITFAACGNVNESANITANIDATGLGSGACFNITGNNLTLDCQGFKILGPNSLTGVTLLSSAIIASNVTVTNCFIANFTTGINEDSGTATTGANITISNNTFFDLSTGIDITGSEDVIIAGNNFTNISTGVGVSSGNLLPHNYRIENNTAYNVSTTLFNLADVEQTVVGNNTIMSSFRFIRIATSVNAPNLTIRDNKYFNTSRGIEFAAGTSRDILIANNTAGNNTFGVLFAGNVRNNTVVNNSFANNQFGVAFTGSSIDNRVENNTFTQNTETGILVNNTAALNVLKNNTFVDNLFAIMLRGGTNNSILNSTINGTRGAINVTASGFNNLINDSTLVQNATFEHQNSTFGPTILIYPVQINVTSQTRFSTAVNITRNRVLVNSTAVPAFNTTADIIIHSSAIRPNATMDPEDDGTFIGCPDPRCVALASTAGRILFRVSQFTSYATNDTAPLTVVNMSVAANATFNGTLNFSAGDGFGFAVASGDFNSDGIKDNAFGAPFAPLSAVISNVGKVYVVYGISPFTPGDNITTVANITITGANASAMTGRSIAAGDLNGDGVDDLVYSAPGIKHVGILFGSAGLGNVAIFENQSNVTLNVTVQNDISLAVGDFNNDGMADLAVGQSELTNLTLQGRVDILYGRAAWPSLINLSQNANLTLNGTAPGDRFGWAVVSGDVNGDGIADLLVSAPRRNITGVPGVGEAYVFFGGSGLVPAVASSANVTLQGEPAAFGINQTNATTGYSLFGQADVNGDGIKDLLIGAPLALAPDSPAKFEAGAVYVVFGRTSLSGTINLSNANVTLYGTFGPNSFGGSPGGERAGFSVYGADTASDSTADLFVGAPLADFDSVADAGVLYLVYGRTAWPRFINLSTANETFVDSASSGLFGFALANGSVLIGDPIVISPSGLQTFNNLVDDVTAAAQGIVHSGAGKGIVYKIKAVAGSSGTVGAAATEVRAGGGYAGSGARCTTGPRGDKGFYSYMGFRACNDPGVQRTIKNPAYRNSVINVGYTECCVPVEQPLACREELTCLPCHAGVALAPSIGQPPLTTAPFGGGEFPDISPTTQPPLTTSPFTGMQTIGGVLPNVQMPLAQIPSAEPLPGGTQEPQGVCLHLKHPHNEFCGNAHTEWTCDELSKPGFKGPTGVSTTIDQVITKAKECCPQKPACPPGVISCYPDLVPGGTQKNYEGLEFRWYWPPEECPEKIKRVPCGGNLFEVQEAAPGLFSAGDINAWANECCPGLYKCGDNSVDPGEQCDPPGSSCQPEAGVPFQNGICDNKCQCVKCMFVKRMKSEWKCISPADRNIVRIDTTFDAGIPKPPCKDKNHNTNFGKVGCEAFEKEFNLGGAMVVALPPQDAMDEYLTCCPQKKKCEKDSDCPQPDEPPKNKCYQHSEKCISWECEHVDELDPSKDGAYCDNSGSPNTPSSAGKSMVPNSCSVEIPGGPGLPPTTIFTFDGACTKDCEHVCALPCPPLILTQFFAGMAPIMSQGLQVHDISSGTDMPLGVFGKILNCYNVQPVQICLAGDTSPECNPPPACEPGSTAPECNQVPPPPCPPGSAAPECTGPPTDCAAAGTCPPPPCAGPTCSPPSNVVVDSPPPLPDGGPDGVGVVIGPIPGIGPTPEPTITPVAVTPIAETPLDFFCAAASAGQGPVSLTAGDAVDRSNLPPGYSIVSVTKVDCAGNYLDMTLNVPDNYEDIKAFMLRPEGKAPLGSETLDSAKCGTAWTEDIRRQQVSTWKAPSVGYEPLTAIEEVQTTFAMTGAERIVSTGKYKVELPQEVPTELVGMQLASAGPITIRLSSPTFNVPQAAHPNLVIIGTPLLVTVSPPFAGRAKITMPYALPAFIDATSIGLYVRVGDQWKYLGGEFNSEEGIISVEVNDLSLAMDNAGTVMFAVMGITCATCPNIQVDKIYDGGSRKAVFLVHGFTTDRLRWQAFIDDLVHTNSDWQIWTVSYPLAMASDDIAAEISSLIERHAAEFDKVSFIAHSIGGILSQKAIQHGLDNQLVWPKKVADVILAGQPGLGSPSADVYGRLFAALVNLKSATMVWNQRSPLLSEAVAGAQVPRAPGVEYFAIAGRQSYPFTYDLFKTQPTEIVSMQLASATPVYLPNDGIISIYSARTVGEQQITDACRHYFEVPRTHTDLLDDWLPRRVMQRALFRNDAQESPDKAIVGYNKYVHVIDTECRPGTLVVIGKPIAEAATKDPLNCKCGDGVCGDGENEVNCPSDCVKGYQYTYWCRAMPWMIGPLVALLVLLTTIYVFRAIKKHERGSGAFWISALAAVIFMLILGHYLLCGFTMPLSILVLVFVLALLGFTIGHLHGKGGLAAGGTPGKAIPGVTQPKKGEAPGSVIPGRKGGLAEGLGKMDDSSIRELERLLEKARGKRV